MNQEHKRQYDRERYALKKQEQEATKPPDPIDLLSIEERAYIAGLVDGEAAIYIGVVGPKPHKTVYPMLNIAMTHLGVLTWVASKTGGNVITLHNHSALARHPGYRTQWALKFFGRRAQHLCRALQPYLIVKAEHAALIAQFPCDERRAPGRRLSPEVNRVRYRLQGRISKLNISSKYMPKG